jgi:hypothetical protein
MSRSPEGGLAHATALALFAQGIGSFKDQRPKIKKPKLKIKISKTNSARKLW